MLCKHLQPLEQALTDAGIKETFRGRPWSENCRQWVYFDCVLNLRSLRERFSFEPCVVDYEHRGTHDGQETGLVCEACHDGVMGRHPSQSQGVEFR